MGNQNLGKQNLIFFFIPKVKYFNHHSFVIYHGISKSLVVLESPLYFDLAQKLTVPTHFRFDPDRNVKPPPNTFFLNFLH
jgi:hypothetical protein